MSVAFSIKNVTSIALSYPQKRTRFSGISKLRL